MGMLSLRASGLPLHVSRLAAEEAKVFGQGMILEAADRCSIQCSHAGSMFQSHNLLTMVAVAQQADKAATCACKHSCRGLRLESADRKPPISSMHHSCSHGTGHPSAQLCVYMRLSRKPIRGNSLLLCLTMDSSMLTLPGAVIGIHSWHPFVAPFVWERTALNPAV